MGYTYFRDTLSVIFLAYNFNLSAVTYNLSAMHDSDPRIRLNSRMNEQTYQSTVICLG